MQGNSEKQCTYFCSFIKRERENEIEEILEEIMAQKFQDFSKISTVKIQKNPPLDTQVKKNQIHPYTQFFSEDVVKIQPLLQANQRSWYF